MYQNYPLALFANTEGISILFLALLKFCYSISRLPLKSKNLNAQEFWTLWTCYNESLLWQCSGPLSEISPNLKVLHCHDIKDDSR